MDLDMQDSGFIASGMSWLATLPDDAIVEWSIVLARSPGYYPSTLHRLWKTELSNRRLLPCMNTSIRTTARLPVGHAQDCEWHFTSSAAQWLISQCVRELPAGSTILHLGSPSTFKMGVAQFGHCVHILAD